MPPSLKTGHGISILFLCLVLAVNIISQSLRDFNGAFDYVPLSFPSGHSQLAAVDGADSGLVGWWKFDEGSGTTAGDASGNGNTGTLIGSGLPQWTTDAKIGSGGLSFTGAGSVKIANNIADNMPAISISAWHKITGNTSNDIVTKYKSGKFSSEMQLLLLMI